MKTQLTKILDRHQVQLEESREDASLATTEPMQRDAAERLVTDLVTAGIEASTAQDAERRDNWWVHVTVEERKVRT